MSINFRGLQERLRERLLAHINAGELTGLQLARATGFQQAHISNFLNRKRGLSLEAMDTILHAAQISLPELFADAPKTRRISRIAASDCSGFVSIPVVDEQDCTATQVPNSTPRDTIKIALPMVQRLQPAMHVPRSHWQRFIAIRVKPADVAAMMPRLARGAVAVIDRHHNSPDLRKSGTPDLFLLRAESGFHIRYIDLAGQTLLARPHQAGYACDVLSARDSGDPLAAIIGRVCFLHMQL